MSARASRVLRYGLVLAPLAYVAAVALTTVWFNRVWVPRIAGED